MLKKEDKIFKNLYNELGWEIDNSIKRDDWKNTKDLILKGREWIINEDYYEDLDERSTRKILDALINYKPIKPGSFRGRKNAAPEKSLTTNGEKYA